jgi:thiamine biosynthesis lipoprotein
MLRDELDRLDAACSRFRPDSELSRAQRSGGGVAVSISGLLTDLVAAALQVARLTDGTVDPTVGAAVASLGYDRDFAAVAKDGPPLPPQTVPAPGWHCIELDPVRRRLRIPAGVYLDLGSSAKAFAADAAAGRIAEALGTGVLVNLGGDIAVAGSSPPGGWPVGLALDSATSPGLTNQVVALRGGGLASSGTTARTWRRGRRALHHIVDPRTGDVADSPWALVTVAAPSCLLANAATTAAVVMGDGAVAWLGERDLPARLVGGDGAVMVVGGWPLDQVSQPAPSLGGLASKAVPRG